MRPKIIGVFLVGVIVLVTESLGREPAPSFAKSFLIAERGSQQTPVSLEQTFHVQLPENYKASAEAFPVLYILYNGYDRFLSQMAILQRLYDSQAVPPMIVIALEADGMRDLTPTQAPAYGPKSGGAPDFVKFLKEKTVPYVEKAFRTKPPRIFWSHSIGGTLGIYALLSAPELFNACLVSSPFFLYDGEARFLLQNASSFLKKRTTEKNYLYVTIGDEPALRKDIEAFLDILKSENPPGLKWDFLPMPGETHDSIQFRSLEAGLRALVSAMSDSLFSSGDLARSYLAGASSCPGSRIVK
jgi:predicted alpha/beta superfamily hydrolase